MTFLKERIKKLKNRIKLEISKVINVSQKVINIENNLELLEIRIVQLESALHNYNKLILPPPLNIQKRIVGGYFKDFIDSGFTNVKEFNQIFKNINLDLTNFRNVLDFGCGCGRILTAYHILYPEVNISGCDIDEEGINYCQTSLKNIGNFKLNNDLPPSHFNESTFDFIYGISVFTHLPEKMQMAWLKELQRICQKDGYLFLTIENEKTHKVLDLEKLEELYDKGYLYFERGVTEGLPDYYRTTFHTYDYIRRVWGELFEIIDIIPLAMLNHQDVIICKNSKID